MTPLLSRRTLGLGALAAATLAACGDGRATSAASSGGGTVSVTHAQGTTQVPAAPRTIVVTDFGALDTIASLGLGDRVVGIPKGGTVPSFLAQFDTDKVANVGSMAEPDIEAINRLKPDLVVIGFRTASRYAELSKHFTTIDVTYKTTGTFYEGIATSAGILGTALGKQAEVNAKLAELKQVIATTKAKMPQGEKGLILMTSASKVTAYGPDSRFGAIHTDLGVPQAVTEIKADRHGQPMSFEAIQQADPALLFVCDRDVAVGEQGKAAKEVLSNELVATTTAWRTGRVVYLDPVRWYIVIHGLDNAKAMIEGTVAGL